VSENSMMSGTSLLAATPAFSITPLTPAYKRSLLQIDRFRRLWNAYRNPESILNVASLPYGVSKFGKMVENALRWKNKSQCDYLKSDHS